MVDIGELFYCVLLYLLPELLLEGQQNRVIMLVIAILTVSERLLAISFACVLLEQLLKFSGCERRSEHDSAIFGLIIFTMIVPSLLLIVQLRWQRELRARASKIVDGCAHPDSRVERALV